MPKIPSITQELEAYSPSDPVVADVLRRAWTAVAASEVTDALEELHLFVINPAVASRALRESRYFTESCQALRDQMTIVVNEQFLVEIEIAIRSFGQSQSLLGTPYLKGDPQFFGFVRRVAADRQRSLDRVRRHAQDTGTGLEAEEAVRQELAMVILFFLAHELGHLLGGHAGGEFSTFVDPNAALNVRIDAAVVRLCRHVDEFSRYQFRLPGFHQTESKNSGVRRVAKRYRSADQVGNQREELFFRNEVAADDWANRIMREYLEALAKDDVVKSDRSLYLLVRGIFAASLYMWYRDLDVFARMLGMDSLPTAADLTISMMRSREQYVHAASLFGDRHRFTLLRAVLAIEAVLRAVTRWFDLPPKKRSIHSEHNDVKIAADPEARREWWLSESLQRYFLFCIAMDTAVKIAYVGCSTGWLVEADARRGTPQLFVMNFESIDQSVARLRQFR